MSKSLGNLVMVRDLLRTWTPDTLRVYLASNHYRDIWSYDEQKLAAAATLARKFETAVTVSGGGRTRFPPAAVGDPLCKRWMTICIPRRPWRLWGN